LPGCTACFTVINEPVKEVNSSHVAMLDFKIEQITGKKIKEN
jgi:hypothetical protein